MESVEVIKRIYCICYPMFLCVSVCVYLQKKESLHFKMQALVILTYYIFVYILQTLN